jgi:DNA-binding winged helix-turn-helix (wHTH) protein
MENISLTNRALGLLELLANKMGGGIVKIEEIFNDFNDGTTAATVKIMFDLDRLREYISQSP